MQRLGNRRRVLAALMALAIVGAACGGDDDDGGSAATEAPSQTTAASGSGTTTGGGADEDDYCTEDRVGGEMTFGTAAPPQGMDPTIVLGTGGYGADFMSAFYDTLMRYDATTQTFEPHVAESLEPNEDFTEWTLTLREGITFGNGDPLTTADVEDSIKRLQQARVRAAGMAQEIVGMEIIDERTMVFDVGEPWGMFPYVLATEPGWITNKNIVAERGEGFNTNPTGAGVGPYEFVRYAPGEELVLQAKDDYWAGPVCIQTIRFINVVGAEPAYEAFENGEMDGVFINNLRTAQRARDAGLMAFETPVGALNYILADQGISGRTDTPFKDVRVREAMQLAIDYDAINARLMDNLEPASTSALVPEASPLYHGVEGPPYDPDRARELVEETVAEGVWDGSFTFLHDPSPAATEAAVLYEALWEAVGMDVTLEAAPNASQRIILERTFEVGSNGFAILDPAPWSTLNGLASDSARQRTGYADPDMDAVLKDLRAASTIEETQQVLAEMQEVWNRTFPLIVSAHGVWAIAAHPHLHGLTFGPDATPYFHKAWVEQ